MEQRRVSSYSRQDVMRILEISSRQLQGWERAGLISTQQSYSFQDLGQLRTLRSLRAESVPAASIRHSIAAMKAVAGMANPLLEASVVRTGSSRIAFRHLGAMVDPIRRQLLFDCERAGQKQALPEPASMRAPAGAQRRHLHAKRSARAGTRRKTRDHALGGGARFVDRTAFRRRGRDRQRTDRAVSPA